MRSRTAVANWWLYPIARSWRRTHPIRSTVRRCLSLFLARGRAGALRSVLVDRTTGGGLCSHGPQQAGYHQLRWNGRDRRRPLPSQRPVPVPAGDRRGHSDAQAHLTTLIWPCETEPNHPSHRGGVISLCGAEYFLPIRFSPLSHYPHYPDSRPAFGRTPVDRGPVGDDWQ